MQEEIHEMKKFSHLIFVSKRVHVLSRNWFVFLFIQDLFDIYNNLFKNRNYCPNRF